MNHFAMDWWMKEEEKRKNRQTANQVHLINNQLSNAIMRLSADVKKEEYREFESEYNRHLVQSGIWYLRYANNFENPLVMGVQVAWIAFIFEQEESKGNLNNLRYTEHEFRRLLNQVKMQDYQAFHQTLHLFPHLQSWQ